MSIFNVIGMIPKGGKYAKSVVNFVRQAPEHWPKFKEAIKQIDDLLKQGKLKLDGKQRTIFETNKNILKNHEKVTKKVELPPSVKKEFPPFNVSKEDPFKGWKPTLYERSNLRNVYKDLDPPKRLYTKEMEAIDEELDALAFGGEKYEGLSSVEKAAIFKKLQAEMKNLIKVAKENDPTKLSLSQLNKKSQNLQKRIREIADNPNIKGTVYEGPKKDMIAAIYDSENAALTNARQVITKRNSELKYGTKYPVLDPENNSFIILRLDESGNPVKISRFTGRFSATKDKKTGELTSGEGTSYYDSWNAKTNKFRKEGEEVFHETLNNEGKVIMSNPDYKIPEIKNMEIWNELYSDLSTSDLAKKGFKLKDIDMLIKGREVKKYLTAQETAEKGLEPSIKMHERTSSDTGSIGEVMEDLYHRGDDIYKMTMKEWITKIPEHFAEGGHVPGFATGGVSNLFRQRQGFRAGTAIELVKGARWVIRMLKELADDMIFGSEQFAKMAEPEKIKLYKETQAAIKHLEAGGKIPENLIQSMRKDPRFQNLTVSKGGDKEFLEIQEVVLGKPTKGTGEKIIEGKVIEEIVPKHRDITKMTKEEKAALLKKYQAENPNIKLSYGQKDSLPGDEGIMAAVKKGDAERENLELWSLMNQLPKDLQHKVALLPVEKQLPLLKKFKEAVDAVKTGGTQKGIEVLQEQLLTDFIPKGKPHATGGLIGYATGGVSNLFRSR